MRTRIRIRVVFVGYRLYRCVCCESTETNHPEGEVRKDVDLSKWKGIEIETRKVNTIWFSIRRAMGIANFTFSKLWGVDMTVSVSRCRWIMYGNVTSLPKTINTSFMGIRWVARCLRIHICMYIGCICWMGTSLTPRERDNCGRSYVIVIMIKSYRAINMIMMSAIISGS